MISFSVNFFFFCYFIPITWEKLIATDSKCQFRPNFIKNLFLPCFQVNILNSKMDKENNSFFCIKFEFCKHYIWKNVRKVLYSQTYIYWPKSMTFETLKSSSIKRFKYVSSWSIHWSRRFCAVYYTVFAGAFNLQRSRLHMNYQTVHQKKRNVFRYLTSLLAKDRG